jgi:hypothetical protein
MSRPGALSHLCQILSALVPMTARQFPRRARRRNRSGGRDGCSALPANGDHLRRLSQPLSASASICGMVALPSARVEDARHSTWHVGHAVMQDAVHLIDRVCMGGGARRFETPALINRHIHQHRALFHAGQLRAADISLGAAAPGISTAPMTISARVIRSAQRPCPRIAGLEPPPNISSR